MAQQQSLVKTLVIDRFDGSMVSTRFGDMNSGKTNVVTSGGYNAFSKPGQLTWSENPVQIDPNASVITDMIVCGDSRLESGIVYVYCVGHTGRVYKIQVNNPSTYNPDYDNPVLLTTLTINSPTFTMGGFISFFDSTGRIYIGHDMGVTRLNFDGSGETFMGSLGSWTQNVPRPMRQFVGSLFIGNGINLAQIDNTSTVVTYTKLSPGLASGYQIRDLDLSNDGNYLQAVATNLALTDITATTPNTSLLEPGDSILASWNGSDMGFTSFNIYPDVVLSANIVDRSNQYVFGYDIFGGSIYNPIDKLLSSLTTSAYSESPNPNAVIAYGGLVSWVTPFYFSGALNYVYSVFGSIEGFDLPVGWWSPLVGSATGTETDVMRVPCQILVSNLSQGASTNGYSLNQVGSAKIYFSTLETSGSTKKYKFYKWTPAPTGLGSTGGAHVFTEYETQTQMFPKRIQVVEVRVYGEPWVANNGFTVDLYGPDNKIISGASKAFTAGGNLIIGNDYAWYNPSHSPTYAVALSITNTGTVNHTINKVELDYVEAGK